MANCIAGVDTDSPRRVPLRSARGDVVIYRSGRGRAAHDDATCAAIARGLAAIKGYGFAGDYDPRSGHARPLYFVPTQTLIGVDCARALGITSEHDLFGGVVPHPFVATKCISHPLADDRARAPAGWSDAFARRVHPVVLSGHAAFDVDDALRGGVRLLAQGPVRLKRALGIGGAGQVVVNDRQALEHALMEVDAGEVSRHGISLEQDLVDVTTYSIGQVRVGDLLASYCGTQRETDNNRGERVYGGSDLFVVRGDFDALLASTHDCAARLAIEQARRYDRAAFECFPGLLASRRNYDVAQGTDARGRAISGVLEQSWRVGGASGAEVEALTAFRSDPSLVAVHASSKEIYGGGTSPPPGASVHFHGTDDRAGPLLKYALLQRHGDT